MPRRKNDMDVALGFAQLVGLLVCAGMFFPSVRQALSGLVRIAILVAALLLTVFVGYAFYRRWRRQRNHTATVPLPATVVSADFRPMRGGQLTAESRMAENAAGAVDLVAHLRTIDWYQFEKLVALTYQNLGFIVTHKGGAHPDGGIDLIIEKDSERMAVQCKQWKTWNVGVKAIREFLGAMTHTGIRKGVFVTLNGYSADAKQLAEQNAIEVLDETSLAAMMKRAGLPSNAETLKILNDKRKFCPKCDSEMVLRTASKGANAGEQFWGCSTFPKCRFTMKI